MAGRDTYDWMWADALDVLARADRLHRQMFHPSGPPARQAGWQPPADVLETDHEVLIIAALPGVAESDIEVSIDGPCLIIAGERTVPPALRTAVIHRLELPQGRFERRLPLPRGRYDQVRSQMLDGCLVVSLRKIV
jgi:HSP20 family molecular chaperone IbpA